MTPVVTRRRPAVIDEAVRAAVRRLLAERGYQAMTIEQVAVDADVAKTAIYRRWPSKAEMVFAAAVHGTSISAPADTGTLAADLRTLVAHVLDLLNHATVRGALPGLVADLRADAELGRRFTASLIEPEREVVATIVRRAVDRGEVRPGVDTDDLHAQLLGTVFAWVYLIDGAPPDNLAERITRALLAVLHAESEDLS